MKSLTAAIAALMTTGTMLLATPAVHSVTTPAPPSIQPTTQPSAGSAVGNGLEQTVASNESVATDKATVNAGHIDLGPKVVEGTWTFLARDDRGKTPVWRRPSDLVVQLPDSAQLERPSNPDYDFLGVKAGTKAFVIPQTENKHVVWLGWNTQDPAALALMGRGAHLELTGVEGPGQVVVFTQDGSFGKPRTLLDSRTDTGAPTSLWADANTHVHANWAFTVPGNYRVGLRWVAKKADGTEIRAASTLRFAVGASASPAELAAAPDLPADTVDSAAPVAGGSAVSTPRAADTTAKSGGMPTWGWVAGGVVLLALLGGLWWRQKTTRKWREEALPR